MSADKITVTLHAQLLTTLVQISYLRNLYRCVGTEQMADAIDRCTFDLLRILFDLLYETKWIYWFRGGLELI